MWSVVCTEGRLWKRKRPGRLGLPLTENYREIIPEWQWGLTGGFCRAGEPARFSRWPSLKLVDLPLNLSLGTSHGNGLGCSTLSLNALVNVSHVSYVKECQSLHGFPTVEAQWVGIASLLSSLVAAFETGGFFLALAGWCHVPLVIGRRQEGPW